MRDAKKSTSTMAKLSRYGTFLCAPAGNFLADHCETAYSRAFRDAWSPEVLFVTRSEARRDLISAVIRERQQSDKYKVPAKAMTLPEAHRSLCRVLFGGAPPPGRAQPDPSVVGPAGRASATSRSAHDAAAQSAAEERLRRGRVSVRGEQLIKFETMMPSTLSALISAQEALARLNVPPDAIPPTPSSCSFILCVLAEYARRGREALSRHGLDAAE